MPRTEKSPHYVQKTNKDHKCRICGEIIPKGTRNVRYKNLFTGKRGYQHTSCPPMSEERLARLRAINDAARQKREPR